MQYVVYISWWALLKEQKHYVQHEIVQQAALIYDLIVNQHAYCFIAG